MALLVYENTKYEMYPAKNHQGPVSWRPTTVR